MSLGDVLSGGAAILVTLAILFVLVIVHEFGHFIVARRFGVRVHEFGIGFPPRARVLGSDGETIYTLNWLPIGGFVRLEGEDGGDRRDARSFAAQSLGRRVVILLAGVAMNLVLAVIVLTAVTAWADPSVSMRFPATSPGSLATALGMRAGDTLEAVDGRRFSYFEGEDPTAALAASLGRQVKLTVRDAAGVTEERIVELTRGRGLRIGLVQDGSPAEAAGLVAGDILLTVDALPAGYLERVEVAAYLREHAGQTVLLKVQHADGSSDEGTATLRPADQIGPGQGALGVSFEAGALEVQPGPPVAHDAGTAIRKGVERTVQALGLVLGALGSLLGSVAADPTQAPPVAGPIGITFAIGSLLQDYPPVFLLWVAGILSANLALINVLPFPPLDGGRIAVGVLQAAVGNRIGASVERLAYLVGFALLMGLLVWITYFDILRGSQIAP